MNLSSTLKSGNCGEMGITIWQKRQEVIWNDKYKNMEGKEQNWMGAMILLEGAVRAGNDLV